jgi:hypothetical protein
MVATTRLQFPDDLAQVLHPLDSLSLEGFASDGLSRLTSYAREEPIKMALWAFGVGFILGWKLKPW